MLRSSRFIVFLWLIPGSLSATPAPVATRATADYVPAEIAAMTKPGSSELRELVDRFVIDRDDLLRFYSVKHSTLIIGKLREFYQAWQKRLGEMNYESLGVEGRIDYQLLQARLTHELSLLVRDEAQTAEIAAVLPVTETIAQLQENRRWMEPVKPEAVATVLDQAVKALTKARAGVEAGLKTGGAGADAAAIKTTQVTAFRASRRVDELRETLGDWFKFYNGYDPQFSWWVKVPFEKLDKDLADYGKFLREKGAGIEPDKDPIIGDPIGREGLMAELQNEMVDYTPEELVEIANKEFAWCDAELKRAAHEMGFGDDWKAALEKVKQDHVAPGEQPALVRKLALEAIDYVKARDLVTVPPLAVDFWRILMMSPEQQKVAPFFLGGDDILVAFPTDTMPQENKLMSLRANNVHFARATVFHELVPGHHLQFYSLARYNPHRQLFMTPFWIEGWSLWWEFYLWDLGFPQSPEDRMGMLFWRTHRCARIIFSLNYHLGKWTPQQCVDFLVDRVGHERASAEGEVRRSFRGDYSPLYQAGYMLGALQLRELHKELVVSGKMKDREFHDSILRGGCMPIELVRARLHGEKLPRDFKASWRFYELAPTTELKERAVNHE